MTGVRLTLAHAILAALGAVELVRAIHQPWVRLVIKEEPVLLAYAVALPVASAAASLIAIWLATRTHRHRALAVQDLAGVAGALFVAFLLTQPMGENARPVLGILYIALLAVRLAPSVLLLARGEVVSPAAAFLVSLVAYGAIAIWSGAAIAAQGDQPHYLLAADRVARGSVDLAPAYANDALFNQLTGGLRFAPGDLETHVARTPRGDRLVQGYGLALVIAPGWALAGKTGALLVLSLFGALASFGTYLLCRDTVSSGRAAGMAWALVTFLAPVSALVGTIYPNVVGAAAIVWSYRLLFTAPTRRPVLAAILAGTTLLLTPRDGVAVLLLAPFALLESRAVARRFLLASAAAIVAISALDLALYGVPLPYAGYGFGIEMAQRLEAQPTLSFHAEVGLPGILFDRAFGLAGSAPYVFLGLAGVVPALRDRRRPLLPALVAICGSVAGLSIYRLWQGGWSPPNRYLVDVLPLCGPFIALGLGRANALTPWIARVLVGLSALASFFLLAIPLLGYNLSDTWRLTDALDDILPFGVLGWLPSFEAIDPAALVTAWLQSIPLWIACAALVWLGARSPRARPLKRREGLGLFLLLNGAAIGLLALAPFLPPESGVVDFDVAVSLVTRWLPFALACGTALVAALAWHAPDPATLYRRHAALYLLVPLGPAIAQFGDRASAPLVAFPLVLMAAAIAGQGLANLWVTRHARSDAALGLLLGATVLATSLAILPYDRSVQLPQSDEPHYLLAMQSLVRDRDLELTNDYDGEYPDLFGARLPDRHIVQVGNAQRPIHDLGLPFLGAIPFALARRTGVLLLMCLVASAFAWRGYSLLRALAFDRSTALGTAAIASLLHPVLTYSTQIYPELPAALALLVATELMVRAPSPGRFAAVSALLGVLIWLTVRAWFIALPFGLVLLVRALRTREPLLVLAALVPATAFAGAYAWLDGAIFGIPLPNAGYFAIRDNQTVVTWSPWIGIPGLVADRTFGLLSHAPIYGLAAFGAVPLWRRSRALASVALAALAAGFAGELLYVGNVRYWWSDGSPAPRYLVATWPFFVCALAAGVDRLRGAPSRMLALAAVVWTAVITFVYVLRPDVRYDIAADVAGSGGPGALWEAMTLAFRGDPALLFPSMVRGAPQDLALALAWTFLLLALVWSGSRRPSAEAPGI